MKWEDIINLIMENREKHCTWTDGEEILCTDGRRAEYIADFLENLGFDCVKTGRYEDETGYYYISID